MREIRIKQYSKKQKRWRILDLIKLRIMNERPEIVCEYIGLIDHKGQDIYTSDLILLENNVIHKQFRVLFSQEHLAYCFQTEDQERTVLTWKEIKGIFGNDFTVTKTGNIFKQGG